MLIHTQGDHGSKDEEFHNYCFSLMHDTLLAYLLVKDLTRMGKCQWVPFDKEDRCYFINMWLLNLTETTNNLVFSPIQSNQNYVICQFLCKIRQSMQN